jgi:hypothetical protein
MESEQLEEIMYKLAYEIASYPPNNLTIQDCLLAFNNLRSWVNDYVLPVIHDLSPEMIAAGFYIGDKNDLALDLKKESVGYLEYYNKKRESKE